MPNMKILTDDVAASATITATTTAGTLSPSNVKSNEPTQIWRATAKTGTLTLTWTSAQSVDAVILGWTNLTDTATVTFNLFTNTADSTPVATMTRTAGEKRQGVAALARNVQAWFDTPRSIRKVTIVISDSTNANNIEAGRVMVGAAYEMKLNPTYGAELAFVDPSSATRMESGAVRREPKKVYRRFSMSTGMMPIEDTAKLMQLAAKGVGSVLFLSLFPDPTEDHFQTHAFVGCTVSVGRFQSQVYRRLSSGLEVEEIV